MKKRAIILFSICLVILIGAFVVDRIIASKYLVELKYSEVIKKMEDKDTFILVISQTICSHCKEYKPVLRKVLKKNKLTAYYIEVDKLSEEEQKEFKKYISFDSTPMTIFLKEGKETTAATRIVGSASEEKILKKLKSNGYIE